MAHKPIAISVIAPAAIAGILIMAILAAISSTNHVFAQAKPTTLWIGTYPCCERQASRGTDHKVAVQTFTGQLLSEGSGVGGATIHIIGVPGFWFGTTSEYGRYGVDVTLDPGTYHIHAHFAGDSDHASSDSRTITFTVTPVTH